MIKLIKEVIYQIREKVRLRKKNARDKEIKEMLKTEALERVWKILKTIPKENMDFAEGSYVLFSHDCRLQVVFIKHANSMTMLVIEYRETGCIKDSQFFDIKETSSNKHIMREVIKYRDEAFTIRKKMLARKEVSNIKKFLA